MTSLPATPGGRRIWADPYEMQVKRVRRFEPNTGKTGKGIVHYLGDEGGWRAVDVEDIVEVNPHSTIRRTRTKKAAPKKG